MTLEMTANDTIQTTVSMDEHLKLLREHAELKLMYQRLTSTSRDRRQGIQYYGAKSAQRDRILSYFPKHRVYIDLFFGTGSLFFAKDPSPVEVVSDLYGDLITLFRVLREQPNELIRSIVLTPYHEAEFEAAHNRRNCGDVEIARRLYVRLMMGFNGSPISKTGWRRQGKQPTGSLPGQFQAISHLYAMANRLSDAHLECKDAFHQIEHWDSESSFFYADPPYVHETRGGGSNQYAHEMSNADHTRLSEALHEIKGMAVLSGYACSLYDDLYKDWECIQFAALDMRSNIRTECLWINKAAQDAMSFGPLFRGQP